MRNSKRLIAASVGADLIGRSAGPVRTPLMDCNAEERAALKILIDKLGLQ